MRRFGVVSKQSRYPGQDSLLLESISFEKQLLGKQKHLMICIYKFNSIFLSAGSLCSCTLYSMKRINHGFCPLHPYLWSNRGVVQGLHCRCTVNAWFRYHRHISGLFFAEQNLVNMLWSNSSPGLKCFKAHFCSLTLPHSAQSQTLTYLCQNPISTPSLLAFTIILS